MSVTGIKSPAVAPAEGPLTEAVLNHARVRQTAARDPQPTWPLEIMDNALNLFFALTEMDRGMRG
jgi:hypothetical protein